MSVCPGCGEPTPANAYGRPRKWCSERCRKRSYGDPCVDCGIRTRFGAEVTRVPEPRCHPCTVEHYRRWTREALIAAIRDWAALYGEPPAVSDWNAWSARHDLHDEARARRFEAAEGRWPGFTVVFNVFGSWNAALIAAGFDPRPAHGGGGNVARRRSQRAKVVA